MVDSVYFNAMNSVDRYELNFNSNGCLPLPANWEDSRKSRWDRFIYPEFQVFFANPDTSLYPSGVPGLVLPDSSRFRYNCSSGYTISFYSSKEGQVQIFLDINPLPGVQAEDVFIYFPAHPGWNVVT